MNLGSTTVLIGAALALAARSLLTHGTRTGWHGGAPSPAPADSFPAPAPSSTQPSDSQ